MSSTTNADPLRHVNEKLYTQAELDTALRAHEQAVRAEERERVVTRFMAIVKDIKGPNVPRVDLYEAMLAAGREILNRDDTAAEKGGLNGK